MSLPGTGQPLNPYGDAAKQYVAVGWRGVIPVDLNGTRSVPEGVTGRAGIDPTKEQIDEWITTHRSNNLGIRLPASHIGIDVDHGYDGKRGGDTIAELEKTLGPLPVGPMSSSRGYGISGIRPFRVPADFDTSSLGNIGPDVEIIHRGWRWIRAWPSVSVKAGNEGAPYFWYGSTGTRLQLPPRPTDFPDLPQPWLDYLRSRAKQKRETKDFGEAEFFEMPTWLLEKLKEHQEQTQDGTQRYKLSQNLAYRCAEKGLTKAQTAYALSQHAPTVAKLNDEHNGYLKSPSAQAYVLNTITEAFTKHDHEGKTCEEGNCPEYVRVITPPREPKEPRRFAFTSGASFALDVPQDVPPVWGSGTRVMWAVGEALMVCGPSGVGKTTIAGQLAVGRLGLVKEVLGMPVVPGKKNVLYLACDRPYQARRSMNRLMQPEWRDVLERLVVWQGPPPEDFAKNTDLLTEMCEAADADTVFVDSLKDVVIGIKEDEPGAAYNRARQTALRAGVQVIELHHQVKRGANGNEPNTISDVYGSVWITAGAGSVMLLWGEPGDPIVKMKHLKQPMEEIGPFNVVHDHDAGTSTVEGSKDLVQLAKERNGLTVKDAAQALFDTTKPTTAETEKTRRRLERLVKDGVLVCQPGAKGSGASTYHVLTVLISNHVDG